METEKHYRYELKYLATYHEYLRQLCEEYVFGGRLEEVYTRIRSQIDELVATDPTAFYTYEEYDAAAKILYEVVSLRAESILGQLDGSIPSTDAGQRADSSALIDASHIDLHAMGEFNMGGDFGDRNNRPNRKSSASTSDASAESADASDSQDGPPGGFDFSDFDFSDFDFSGMSFGFGSFSGASFDGSAFPGASGQSTNQTQTALLLCGACLVVILIPIILLLVLKRKRGNIVTTSRNGSPFRLVFCALLLPLFHQMLALQFRFQQMQACRLT